VRIAPDQISINDPEAIQVYIPIARLMISKCTDMEMDSQRQSIPRPESPNPDFTMPSYRFIVVYSIPVPAQTIHAKERYHFISLSNKIVSHTFSAQAIGGFEPYISKNISLFLRQMDKLLEPTGTASFDFLKWANYLAFDIIGDLAFGEAFHFIEAGNDHNNGIRVLNERGEWSATVGTMPWIKPYMPYIFWDNFFPQGLKSVKELAQIAITAVEKRKKGGGNRKDLLHFLMSAKDPDTGEEISDGELKAEALTQLIAGSGITGSEL
jgi:hypothetical protein